MEQFHHSPTDVNYASPLARLTVIGPSYCHATASRIDRVAKYDRESTSRKKTTGEERSAGQWINNRRETRESSSTSGQRAVYICLLRQRYTCCSSFPSMSRSDKYSSIRDREVISHSRATNEMRSTRSRCAVWKQAIRNNRIARARLFTSILDRVIWSKDIMRALKTHACRLGPSSRW